MRIEIVVKPNARENRVELLPDGRYQVRVTASPHEGEANTAVIGLLAKYFDKPKSHILIIHGTKGKRKVVEVGC